MKLRVPLIDWKRELAELRPFLQQDGGVVQIRTTPESPASAFTKALRSHMELQASERRWLTIQIDGNNAATRYASDMITQIERSLGLPRSTSTSSGTTIDIGTGIQAGGNVNISDVNVTVNSDSSQNHERAERIIRHLREQASRVRLGLFFFESEKADPRELAAFRTLLWERGFEDLVASGLLVVDVGHGTVPNWPPAPALVIDLVAHYDDQARMDAIEDLTKLALSDKVFLSEQEARAFAQTMVASNSRPKDLCANLAGVLTRLSARK